MASGTPALFVGVRGGRIDPRTVRTLVHRVTAGAGVPGGPSVEAVPLPEESFYPPEEYPELVLPPVPDGCPKPLVELGVHVQADWFPVVVANGQARIADFGDLMAAKGLKDSAEKGFNYLKHLIGDAVPDARIGSPSRANGSWSCM